MINFKNTKTKFIQEIFTVGIEKNTKSNYNFENYGEKDERGVISPFFNQ